jgi:lipoprotein
MKTKVRKSETVVAALSAVVLIVGGCQIGKWIVRGLVRLICEELPVRWRDYDVEGYCFGFFIAMILMVMLEHNERAVYKRGREDERREWKG